MSNPVPVTRLDRPAVDLRREASWCSDGAVVRRLLAIALVLEARPRTEATEVCGMDRQTLRDWVHYYNADSIDRLATAAARAVRRSRRPEQVAAFKALVARPDLARDGVVHRAQRPSGLSAVGIRRTLS